MQLMYPSKIKFFLISLKRTASKSLHKNNSQYILVDYPNLSDCYKFVIN